MNIFALDIDPRKAAQYHCDKHVVKMILESAQMMCTVASESSIDVPYRPTHKNHPCTQWVRQSFNNFLWLRNLLINLNAEYMQRFNHTKEHKSFIVGINIPIGKLQLPRSGLTSFALAMPDQYKNKNAVIAYRNYYIGEKRNIANWRNGQPWWWK